MIRTCDLSFRKRPLYPTELRGQRRLVIANKIAWMKEDETQPGRWWSRCVDHLLGQIPSWVGSSRLSFPGLSFRGNIRVVPTAFLAKMASRASDATSYR